MMAGERGGNLFPRPVYEEPPQEQRSKLVQSRVLRGRARVAANHSELGLLEPSDDGWNFAALCRGEELRARLPHILRCRLETRRGQPWLRLGPALLEEVHSQPDISVFHNIISPAELADIRHTAAPRVSTQSISHLNNNCSTDASSLMSLRHSSRHPRSILGTFLTFRCVK